MFEGEHMVKHYCLYLIISAIIFPIAAFGQDYKPVRDGSVSFFSNLEGLRVDSVKQTTEGTEYYFQKTWNFIDNNGSDNFILKPMGPSWLGHKCIVSNDGTQRFIIDNKDTCTLKPFNPIGESWTIDEYTDRDKQTFTITGSVAGRFEKEFLGFRDSVIVIKLKRFDKNNVELPVPDSSVVELSKNYGYTRIFQFYNFEKSSDRYHIDYSQSFPLIGITNPLTGRVFLTPRQIYNYNIGDEFHYYSESVDLQESYQWSYSTIKKVIDKYVSADTDTIIYTFDIKRQIKSPVWGETKFDSIYTGIETQKYIFDKKFYLPLEPFFYYHNFVYANYAAVTDYFYRVSLREDGRIESSAEENGEFFEPSIDNTWKLRFMDNGSTQICAEGLGVTYTGSEDMFEWGFIKLVYYKKGTEVWGTPLDFTSVEDNPADELDVFPNPVRSGENMVVSNLGEGSHSIEIFNALGTKVYNIEDIYYNHSFKIENLPTGMYFIIIRTGTESIMKKIIVY